MKYGFLALLALLTAAPSPAAPLALEIYNAAEVEAASACRAAGFNTLVVGSREQLDLCERFGLRGMFGGIPHAGDQVDREAIAERVRGVMDHPALEGYILIDEPDLRPWSAPPSRVAEFAEAVRAIDASKPITATFSGFLGARALAPYLGALDGIRLDPYPFYYGRPLAWPVEVIDLCRAATGDGKPIRLIQQAWSSTPDFPSVEDDLCLSWLGLIHGVDSFSHYAYRFGDRGTRQTLPEDEPEFWDGLRANTARLASLGRLNPPPASARVSVTAADGRSRWALFEREGETVLLLCNPTGQPEWVHLGVPAPRGGMAELDSGHALTDPSTGGAWIELAAKQVLAARVSGALPEPSATPLWPVTLEFPSLEADVYQTVILRNHGPALAGARIRVNDSPATVTDLPSGVAANRIVRVAEPLGLATDSSQEAAVSVESAAGEILVEARLRTNQLTMTSGGWTASAGFAPGTVLGPGARATLTAELRPPDGVETGDANLEIYLPWQADPAHTAATIRNRAAEASIEVILPADQDTRSMMLPLRWVVTSGGATRDLWLSLPVTTKPLLNTVAPNPVAHHPRRMASPALFAIAGRFIEDTTVHMTLDAPEGWRVWMPSSPAVFSAAQTRGTAAFTLSAPGGRFGRDEATLTFDTGRSRTRSVPVTLSVPLYADPADAGANLFSNAAWEGVREETLESSPADDLSATLQLQWSTEALAIRCAVRDNNHVPHTDEGGVWRGDSLQISLLATPWRHRTPESGDGAFVNFGLAFDARRDTVLKDFGFGPEGIEREVFLQAVRAEARRRGDRTIYTFVVPWSAFGAESGIAKQGASFSLLINDYDDDEKSDRHWLEFGGGIVRGADPYHYADLILADRR